MNSSLITHVLTAALRDRLIASLIILLIVATSLSIFMGSAAVIEQDQFAIVFTAASVRFAGMVGLTLFVVFFIRRSFEAKDIEFLLSRPIGRAEFLLSYAAAFAILAVMMGAAQGLCLYILGPQYFGSGAWLWMGSIIAENVIMVCTALFFSMVLSSSASAAMAVFGFYVLARLMGQILGIIDSGLGFVGADILNGVMEAVSVITPRLDLIGQTSWLIYGIEGSAAGWEFVTAQLALFTILILTAALIDLVKRQF